MGSLKQKNKQVCILIKHPREHGKKNENRELCVDTAVIEFCVEKHGKLKSNSFGRETVMYFCCIYVGLAATVKIDILCECSGSILLNETLIC